jgi:SAM-dependent methyltransferase
MRTERENPIALLRARGLGPRKSLGQHFLKDETYLRRIVAAADLSRADTVLEIGPGPGNLTRLLAEAAGRVIAVELDDNLIPLLRERFISNPHVHIVHGDILQLSPSRLSQGPIILKPRRRRTRSSPTFPTTSPLPRSATCWKGNGPLLCWCSPCNGKWQNASWPAHRR